MEIKRALFVVSNIDYKKCPPPDKPEYAFIGRSNVGKSSLINMLVAQKKLAKTSATPGKTQLINHFLINDLWYLVDLPGYGYAKVSKKERRQLSAINTQYILKRPNLINLFVLIDARHSPQKIDLEFIEWLGINQVPFCIVFTKADKLSKNTLEGNISLYKKALSKRWEQLPQCFISSVVSKMGRAPVLTYIDKLNSQLQSLS